jgi:hypothetical protein
MSFVITDQDTINAIQDAYNAQNLPLAYTLVFDAISNVTTAVVDGVPVITTSPAAGVDAGVWAWVGGAINVNTNSGAFAQYIRDYTAEQWSSIGFGPGAHWIRHAYRQPPTTSPVVLSPTCSESFQIPKPILAFWKTFIPV